MLQFEPIFSSPAIVILTMSVLAGLLLLRPRFQQLGWVKHSVLILLRVGLLLLLLLAMLRPSWVSTATTRVYPAIVIGFDQSRSMTLPQESGSTRSRWQAQQEALQAVEGDLARLNDRFEITTFSYDTDLYQRSFSDGGISMPNAPVGDRTDVPTPMMKALSSVRGRQLAAMIWLGDGRHTMSGPSTDLRTVEYELQAQQAPLYVAPLGPAGEQIEAKDLAIVNFPDQLDVYKDNNIVISGMVHLRGMANIETGVTLTITNNEGKKETLGPFPVMASQGDEFRPIEIPYTPREAGQFQLSLRVLPQSGELETGNNELNAQLTVRDGRLKVLYLTGDITWEQKFLRRSLDASRDLTVDFQWHDSKQRDRWPVDLSKLIEDGNYDVFVIADLDSAALHKPGVNERNLQLIAEQVAAGKALMMLGGYHSFGPGGYRNTPLANLLPIIISRLERQDFDGPISEDLHLPGPIKMKPTGAHPITMLGDDTSNNVGVWANLPELTGANKFHDVKPAARLLLESSKGEPLMLSQEIGGGRVVAFAGDSTWRWWLQGHKTEHRRFWRQTILWLANRDFRENKNLWVRLPRQRFSPGAEIEFTTGVRTDSGAPVSEATMKVKLISLADPSNAQELTSPLAFEDDHRAGVFAAPNEPGNYRIEVTSEQDGKILTASSQFSVFDYDAEIAETQPDHRRLARLANATEEFGGRVISLSELQDVLKEIEDRPLKTEVVTEQRQWRLGRTWWDAWLFVLAAVGLLTVEWVLRKWWDLV